MDHTLQEWLRLAAASRDWAKAAIQAQHEETRRSPEEIRTVMRSHWHDMQQAIQTGMDAQLRSVSGLSGGQAVKLLARVQTSKALSGTLLGKAEAYALATAESNACMGKIVAAPTAGACGILPGLLQAMMEEKQIDEEKLVDALFVAAAVGEAIACQASISGAEGGCQAECGSAASMAAAALVYLEGGTPEQSASAAAFALMNLLGLVCDPVGGLVEVPCVYRNVGAVGIAITAAEMALSGIVCPIQPDEVILAMKEVGDALPASLRETGEGGCAACPSIKCKLHF